MSEVSCVGAEDNSNYFMVRFLSLLSALFLGFAPSLFACPGCKEPSNVAGDGGVSGISAGFSLSVLFMIGFVVLLLTGMTFMIVRSCKQLDAKHRMVSAQSH
jgi:hypothetical protein